MKAVTISTRVGCIVFTAFALSAEIAEAVNTNLLVTSLSTGGITALFFAFVRLLKEKSLGGKITEVLKIGNTKLLSPRAMAAQLFMKLLNHTCITQIVWNQLVYYCNLRNFNNIRELRINLSFQILDTFVVTINEALSFYSSSQRVKLSQGIRE